MYRKTLIFLMVAFGFIFTPTKAISTTRVSAAAADTIFLPLAYNNDRTPTQVIYFYPTGLDGPAKYGSCWTSSNWLQRSDAWRCMDTNSYIYDPCISPIGVTNYVVCDADPLRGRDGFKLFLTQPLPQQQPDVEEYAWELELKDGTTCTLVIASTWPTCLPRYSCSDGLSMTDYPKPGYVWSAERGIFSDQTCAIDQPVSSDIRIVWK